MSTSSAQAPPREGGNRPHRGARSSEQQVVVHDRRAALVALGEALADHEARRGSARRAASSPPRSSRGPRARARRCSPASGRCGGEEADGCFRSERTVSRTRRASGRRRRAPSRSRRARCRGSRRCCCRAGCVPFRRRREQRHTLREEQRREEVALLPLAQRAYRALIGGALHAAVPAAVVVRAVAVALEVGLVALALVAHEVVQREAVVRGDEVDARGGRAAATAGRYPASPRGARRARRSCPRRLSSRSAPRRDTCRSTRPSPAGSCRAGSRPRPGPKARRSA